MSFTQELTCRWSTSTWTPTRLLPARSFAQKLLHSCSTPVIMLRLRVHLSIEMLPPSIASLCTSIQKLEAGTVVFCLQGSWLIASNLGIVKEWASTGANDPIAATRTVQLGYDACDISMCFLFFPWFWRLHVMFCFTFCECAWRALSFVYLVYLVLVLYFSFFVRFYHTYSLLCLQHIHFETEGIWKHWGCSSPEVTTARPGTPGTLCHPAWSLGPKWSKWWGALTDFRKADWREGTQKKIRKSLSIDYDGDDDDDDDFELNVSFKPAVHYCPEALSWRWNDNVGFWHFGIDQELEANNSRFLWVCFKKHLGRLEAGVQICLRVWSEGPCHL